MLTSASDTRNYVLIRATYCLWIFAFVIFGLRSAVAETHNRPMLGAYLWGGLLNNAPTVANFHSSVRFLLDNKFEAIRFTVSPNSLAGYGFKRCSNNTQMSCALTEALGSDVFDDPRLKLVMITLHDFAAPQSVMTDIDKFIASKTIIKTELEAALDLISMRFKDRNISIILSNWEGDNIVYCGGVYRFVSSASFAQECSSKYGAKIEKRLSTFTEWLAYRDDIINSYANPYPSVSIRHAPEINNIVLFQYQCKHSCADNVTLFESISRKRKWSVCSYSAYDSVRENLLKSAVSEILGHCSKIVIGEAGVRARGSSAPLKSDTIRRDILQFAKLNESNVLALIIWNAFEVDGSRDPGFGLFTSSGKPYTFDIWQKYLTR